jgi:hypothetical protein
MALPLGALGNIAMRQSSYFAGDIFIARRCIGKTDAARAWTVRDFPYRTLRR